MIRRPRRPVLALTACLAIAACGSVDYAGLSDKGVFTGGVLVLWLAENETGAGDGRFVYLPYPGRELVFTRDESGGREATVTTIEPGVIYTDGGSIPRWLQPLKGFSPWGYAPAYMIHDWLFVARRCARDGAATPEEAKIEKMPFTESAEILGEAIKALIAQNRVAPNDVAPLAISSGVAGPFSRVRWEAEGECVPGKDRLTPEHRDLVEGYLQARANSLRTFGVQPADREGQAVRVVGTVEF